MKMKLKEGFITDKTCDGYVAVATGEASKVFNGMIKNNPTANFLFEQCDVHNFITKLRETGLLDE